MSEPNCDPQLLEVTSTCQEAIERVSRLIQEEQREISEALEDIAGQNVMLKSKRDAESSKLQKSLNLQEKFHLYRTRGWRVHVQLNDVEEELARDRIKRLTVLENINNAKKKVEDSTNGLTVTISTAKQNKEKTMNEMMAEYDAKFKGMEGQLLLVKNRISAHPTRR